MIRYVCRTESVVAFPERLKGSGRVDTSPDVLVCVFGTSTNTDRGKERTGKSLCQLFLPRGNGGLGTVVVCLCVFREDFFDCHLGISFFM